MNVKKQIILILILLSYFITAIDGSIVITGLTKIAEDLKLTHTTLSWVQNAYILAFGGFMLMGGSLGDTFGRKRMFNLSLLLFGIGSLGAGVAQNANYMIASRFLQGIGAAILAPTSLALIMDYFEDKERVKVVAWYGSISGLGLCIGLIVGGAITSYSSWRDGFLINIPIIAGMFFLSLKYLENENIKKFKFDLSGTLFSVTGVFCILYAIDGATQIIKWLVGGIVLLVIFVINESKSPMPIMPLRLFAESDRRNAYIARTLLIAALMGYNFFISEWMQVEFHYTPLLTGCAFFPMTITTFIGAIKVPALICRYGNKRVLTFGFILLVLGFCCLLLSDKNSTYLYGIGIPMIFIGFGQGLAMSPLTNLGLINVEHKDAGAASGLVNISHQIGGALGLSTMVAASNGMDNISDRFHTGMIVALICIILALCCFTISWIKHISIHKKYII